MKSLLLILLLGVVKILHGESVAIQSSEFPWAIVGTGYDATIDTGVDGRCPTGDLGMYVAAGKLPRGLEIRGQKLLGTPRETGTFHFAIKASNICSSSVKSFELTVTGKPILRVIPEEVIFQYRLGQPVPPPRAVQISATWPNLAYAIQFDAGWLAQTVRGGITPDRGSGLSSDVISVGVDPKELAPGTYHTAIRFSAWLSANSPAVAVTLIVLPAQAAIPDAPKVPPIG